MSDNKFKQFFTHKGPLLEAQTHIAVTLEPEQVIPSQDCPQGSPFCDTQFVSWDGEFMLVYKTLRAFTVQMKNKKDLDYQQCWMKQKLQVIDHNNSLFLLWCQKTFPTKSPVPRGIWIAKMLWLELKIMYKKMQCICCSASHLIGGGAGRRS